VSGEEVGGPGKEAGGRKDTLRSRDSKSASAASPSKNPTKPVASQSNPAATGKRGKAVARVKTKMGAHISPVADKPAVPRKVGRKRSFIAAASVPISAKSNRALLGQNELNQRFPKSYISSAAPKKSPVPNLTLGRAWHVVSALKHALFCIVSRQIVVI
jgi:hypothetical protein